MPLKEIQLPQDLMGIAELAIESFQYPDNPSWNIREDEAAETVDTITRLKQLWPLIRPLTVISPALQDILRGFFWVDEQGKVLGSAITRRIGSSQTWEIGNVAVLPAHRRRGIGRKLVQASLDLIRARGGRLAWLEVVKDNQPAYELYLKLGFKPYSGDVIFEREPPFPDEPAGLPAGVSAEPLPRSKWQLRYALDLRIVPQEVKVYEPVEPDQFRHPLAMYLLGPIIAYAQGVQTRSTLLREIRSPTPFAIYGTRIPTRGTGLIMLRSRVDPERPELARPVVRSILSDLARSGVELRAEWILPNWMPAVIEAASDMGFQLEYETIRMGQILEPAR